MKRSAKGEILWINTASATLLGLSEHSAIGKNLYDLVDEDTASRLRRRDLALISGQDSQSYTEAECIRDHKGKTSWQNHGRVRFEQGGDADPTIYSIATDITAAIVARNEAQDVSTQMRMVQDVAQVGYWSIDLDTQPNSQLNTQPNSQLNSRPTSQAAVHWSKEVYRIHRVAPGDYTPVFETAIKFYHPDDIDEVRSHVARVAKDAGTFLFHKRLLCTGGEIVHITSHGQAVQNEQGKVIKIVGVLKETDGRSQDG
jgi:two-component system CheB/CheR fusion protein